tara:strand:- start:96 stop:416 length:321 start_codon:yes stop_codon:yes gene_type:complete
MASKTVKSKSDEKPSPELQALYKEYWATKTKFGHQIMDAMERFGVYSDQVERIELRERRAIADIYSKIEKQKQKESQENKKVSGSTGTKKKSKTRKNKKSKKKSKK